MKYNEKLRCYRERINLTIAQFASRLGMSDSYGAIERGPDKSGGRRIGIVSAKKLYAHFKANDEWEMSVGLLAHLVDTDTEALTKQLESAAWHYPPELPEENGPMQTWVEISYYGGSGSLTIGRYNEYLKCWQTWDFGELTPGSKYFECIRIYAWRYRVAAPMPSSAPQQKPREAESPPNSR